MAPAGLMLPRATVGEHLSISGFTASKAEVDSELRRLEDKSQVVSVTSEDAPGGSRWKITDGGKARLAENNLL